MPGGIWGLGIRWGRRTFGGTTLVAVPQDYACCCTSGLRLLLYPRTTLVAVPQDYACCCTPGLRLLLNPKTTLVAEPQDYACCCTPSLRLLLYPRTTLVAVPQDYACCCTPRLRLLLCNSLRPELLWDSYAVICYAYQLTENEFLPFHYLSDCLWYKISEESNDS